MVEKMINNITLSIENKKPTGGTYEIVGDKNKNEHYYVIEAKSLCQEKCKGEECAVRYIEVMGWDKVTRIARLLMCRGHVIQMKIE